MPTADLSATRLFLAASVPPPLQGRAEQDAVYDLIAALLPPLFLGGGSLVFGGHPTITPLVHTIATGLGVPPGRITLHQLRRFGAATPWQARAPVFELREHGALPGGDINDELTEMRHAMLEPANAALFVGGQLEGASLSDVPGLVKERDIFRGHHRNGRVLLTSLCGGITAARLIPDAQAGWETHDRLNPEERAILWSSRDVDVVATLTVAALRRA